MENSANKETFPIFFSDVLHIKQRQMELKIETHQHPILICLEILENYFIVPEYMKNPDE